MGIRETLNENPRLTTGITIGIIVLVLLVIAYQIFRGPGGEGGGTAGVTQYYFTVDEGQNYFPDDRAKIPPFDSNGKEAVRARVFKGDGKTFVNHLERFTPDAKTQVEAITAAKDKSSAPGGADPTAAGAIMESGMEVKRPGDKNWVKQSDPKYSEVVKVRCNSETWGEVFP